MLTHLITEGKTNIMQRIAKVLSRAGIVSRRGAEKLVLAGSVSVNGSVINDPATKVTLDDEIMVNGRLVDPPEKTRLWRFHKPTGLVTTNFDEKGRFTVYDYLPKNLPKVMSIGRLDIASEGLLLLTNDGELKRHLELPSLGFVRKYRVRVKGIHNEALLDKLRAGIRINREKFRPMVVTLVRINKANVWYNIEITEGRNREIRRAFDEINMSVNRLIRVSFGAFELGSLARGRIEEIPTKFLERNLKAVTS